MNRKDKEENEKLIRSTDYLGTSASSWDCTGLIPSAPRSRAELESYEDLYPYLCPGASRNPEERILEEDDF